MVNSRYLRISHSRHTRLAWNVHVKSIATNCLIIFIRFYLHDTMFLIKEASATEDCHVAILPYESNKQL